MDSGKFQAKDNFAQPPDNIIVEGIRTIASVCIVIPCYVIYLTYQHFFIKDGQNESRSRGREKGKREPFYPTGKSYAELYKERYNM
jgi:hypothetical protein